VWSQRKRRKEKKRTRERDDDGRSVEEGKKEKEAITRTLYWESRNCASSTVCSEIGKKKKNQGHSSYKKSKEEHSGSSV
jgi:hypothetical protein